jgi:Phage integrase family
VIPTTDLSDGWVRDPHVGSVARRSWPAWARCGWWLLRHPSLLIALAAMVVVGVVEGLAVLGVVVVLVVVVLAAWARLHRASFDATAGRVVRGVWRSGWTYGARWRASMMFAGLGGRLDGGEWLPRVSRVRAGRWADRVTVRMVVGQQPTDWERRSEALAHAFGARSCQVTVLAGRPGYLELTVGRQDVAIPAVVVPELRAHLDSWSEPGPDGRVFVGPKGGIPRRSNFQATWDKAIAEAGVPGLHVHDLRHTGNMLAAESASLRELMARMGHSSTRAALIYQHASRDRERAIAAAVSARVEAARTRAKGHGRGTDPGSGRNPPPGQKRRKRP